ncbi:hypothetical protein ACIBQ1_38105 [Nonomuraea sp. NPDC050153]|uniref:hypothetical protein n=1 Tax=Nonomuraea sp. NPDC050153 TaxID=3364359 RepID=UPI0037B131F9
MPRAKTATTRDQVKGCGCLIVTALLIVGGCNSLFGSDQPSPAAPAVPSMFTPTPAMTWQAESIKDLDDDGIADRYDGDADGDGVTKIDDRDDRDATKGKRRPARTAKPTPKDDPVPLANAHPGGFCGTQGAVGIASNGRTYTCRGGHWRR